MIVCTVYSLLAVVYESKFVIKTYGHIFEMISFYVIQLE